MGISLSLIQHDEVFAALPHQPILINELSDSTEDEKKALNNLIYTTYSGDVLSNVPSCKCQKTIGVHNENTVCVHCDTVVAPKLEESLRPIIWARVPKGVAAFINPSVWIMLKRTCTKNGFQIVRWLCDTTYRSQTNSPGIQMELESVMAARGLKRGYNSFVQNFEQFMDVIINLKVFRGAKGTDVRDVARLLLGLSRGAVFSQYLPWPNKATLVIEKSNSDSHTDSYTDPITPIAVNAIRLLVGIDSDLANHSLHTKQTRTVKAIDQYSEYFEETYKTIFARKQGVFRKHVFGSRSHFSFRAVVSSLTNDHYYGEMHIPWGIAVASLDLHLRNKLLVRGYTPVEAKRLLNEHVEKYHPLLDQLFDELISESPYTVRDLGDIGPTGLVDATGKEIARGDRNRPGIHGVLQRNLQDIGNNFLIV